MNRRKFIQLGVVGAGATLAGVPSLRGEPASSKKSTTIAMPISIAALVQRDLDAMFADMRERAGVRGAPLPPSCS